MREDLRKLLGVKLTFKGTITKHSVRISHNNAEISTVMLEQIRLDKCQKIITDHLWFDREKFNLDDDLEIGSEVRFKARVTQYLKASNGCEDYCLSMITSL